MAILGLRWASQWLYFGEEEGKVFDSRFLTAFCIHNITCFCISTNLLEIISVFTIANIKASGMAYSRSRFCEAVLHS